MSKKVKTKTKKEKPKPKPKSKYSNAGKGDKSRVSDANKYAENWEKIFGKKKFNSANPYGDDDFATPIENKNK